MPEYTSSVNANNTIARTRESSTVLAANATFNGAAHDGGAAGVASTGYSRFRVFAYSDQAGTVNIQTSVDGTTWYTDYSASQAAASPSTYEYIMCLEYVRVQFVNGSTLQTVFELDSCMLAI